MPNPQRCGTDAKPLLSLWRALGKPPPPEFEADFSLVAEWARDATDPLAARDIRAIGWDGGTDRHRDITTLAAQNRWQARLDAARAWQAADRPTTRLGANAVPFPRVPRSTNQIRHDEFLRELDEAVEKMNGIHRNNA